MGASQTRTIQNEDRFIFLLWIQINPRKKYIISFLGFKIYILDELGSNYNLTKFLSFTSYFNIHLQFIYRERDLWYYWFWFYLVPRLTREPKTYIIGKLARIPTADCTWLQHARIVFDKTHCICLVGAANHELYLATDTACRLCHHLTTCVNKTYLYMLISY